MKELVFFIVDDDTISRKIYQQHLANLGFTQVHEFSNGTDCLENLDLQPDVMFLDYDMTPINGIELLKKVKQICPNIQLLMLSGQKDLRVAVDAMKNGAFDYIVKGEKDLEKIAIATVNLCNNLTNARYQQHN
jgi:DNA-binding NtrC family response regulator